MSEKQPTHSLFDTSGIRRRYRFELTSCSQCGRGFGPGDHGFSHCKNHRKASALITEI
jgi:uncharacterized OB-fold protein